MVQLQQNRYLWVHFVGLATVPLLLDGCLAGLASAAPAFGYPAAGSLQFWAIALFGIVPTLWMQLAKPFYIFSLPPLALKPTELTDDQRRCLQLLKTLQMKILAVVTAGLALWLLWWLYGRSLRINPVITPAAGLIIAAVSFFFICALLQISVSAGRSILVGPKTLQRVVPVESSAIATDFLILGLRVKKILPQENYIDSANNDRTASAKQPVEPSKSSSPDSSINSLIDSPTNSLADDREVSLPLDIDDADLEAIATEAKVDIAASDDQLDTAASEDIADKDSES
ncbi:MAG: low-complexity tail membrane protein [Phormidesmis sp.]